MRFKIFIFAILIGLWGCNYPDDFEGTSVAIGPVERVYSTAAVITGSVTTSAPFEEFGVCWSLYDNPSPDGNHIVLHDNCSDFSVTIIPLTPNKRYYARNYVKFSSGIMWYSNTVNFTTKGYDEDLPKVDAELEIREQRATSVELSCRVKQSNDLEITERGFCWSDDGYTPYIYDNKIICGQGEGAFSGTLGDMKFNTSYRVRAYAINAVGVAYSSTKTISINKQDFVPTIGFGPTIVSKEPPRTTLKATVTDDKGYAVIDRGFCYSPYSNPTLSSYVVKCGAGSGEFSGTITPSSSGTHYVRAYATNANGTTYSPSITINRL